MLTMQNQLLQTLSIYYINSYNQSIQQKKDVILTSFSEGVTTP